MPGTKIANEDRQTINQKLICSYCNLLLSTPMQSACGHFMCSSCVDTILVSSDARCPVDGTELNVNIFPDTYTEREIQALSLHCPNEGCVWHGTYAELKLHSEECEHALMRNCVNSKCKMEVRFPQLNDHLTSECEYRKVKCNYCQKDGTFASIRDHVSKDCAKAPITCEFCRQKFVRKDIERHKESCGDVIVECEYQAVGCNERTLKRRELGQHSNDGFLGHLHLLFLFVCDLVSKLATYVPRLEFTQTIQILRDEMADVRSGLFARWNITGEQPIISYNGTLIWRIEGYEKKRQAAVRGLMPALYSQHFYSAQDGYKMCAKLYMNGDGFGKGTHLSLYFIVMKGEYDSLQTWPFQKKITMMLMDQGNGDHMVEAFHSDPQSSSFLRPRSNMNIPSGSPLFMPIEDLGLQRLRW
ncbi:TNF receptor-associated factor 2-like isoform X2 [Dendronephthya gigantea]|uniref:TNF receptor-associated factor 2-like isoform X2 n=1 Tax=Dendronephthya gigantea TaxID=151771 RepID=UPI00106AE988|nr:TNF receptor-associated factor 2-like isoform X2 [Dendronephthya gigantea]